jgi:hypothetical protein
MKYFGEKSLSSKASRILDVLWYLALAGMVVAFLIAVMSIFSISFGDPFTTGIAQGHFPADRFSTSDKKDWAELRNLPLVWKLIILPYIVAVAVLLLLIIRKTRSLFANFRKDIVFDAGNIVIISHISKLNIGFSLLTWNPTALLISVVLFLFCEVLKRGAVLQEEQDLTI